MPLTNAQKQKDTRARRKAKLERYEAALREIVKLADTNTQSAFLAVAGNWARNALAPDEEMGRGL